jgi:hypothetical protein
MGGSLGGGGVAGAGGGGVDEAPVAGGCSCALLPTDLGDAGAALILLVGAAMTRRRWSRR